MATGLFEALSKYAPREGKNPLENFITEGFAWILNEYPDFGKYFLKYLENELNKRGQKWSFGNYDCEWRTQEKFGGKQPDMVCHFNGENKAIVFEHKTWSPLHGEQLVNYKDFANQEFADHRIVLITATRQQHQQDPDLALCWPEIYGLISNWEESGNSEFLINDFQQLLKSLGLGPPAPISHTSIRYYYKTWKLETNIIKLIERVKGREDEKREWEKILKKDYELSTPLQRGKDHFYGRIGIELLSYEGSLSWARKYIYRYFGRWRRS